MSVILKEVDLPRNQTIVIHYANRYGEMETVYVDESDIIQIPKDHGNIIDESKAVVTETIDGYYEITAPTILEAEGYDGNKCNVV